MNSGSQRRSGWARLIAVMAIMCAGAAWGDGEDIGPGDWQYRELDALGRAGLLSGHPKGPIGDWTDRLSRYEAAALALRAVEGVGEVYEEQGKVLHQIARADAAVEQPIPRGVSVEDLARVEKLIEEFRTELVTMGARVDDLETALKEVQQHLDEVAAEQKKHKIDGYAQFRYEADDAPDGKEQFAVRRARVNLRGPVSEKVSYRVEFQLDAKETGKSRGSKVQLRTAYADYKLHKSTLRIGQAKVPWGYELLESVPKLWTGERAFFMDRLFPNQRDIGVQVNYRRSPTSPQIDVGVFNGTGINANDNNDRKNVMARMDFPLSSGTVALSTYTGSNEEGAAATRQDRYGASARLKSGDGTEFLGEFVTGKDKGYDVRGWHAQLGHPISKHRGNLLFVKYDQYDENSDVPEDLFKRWSLGYWWELDPVTRLTLVHERRQVDLGFSELSKWDGDATYLQLQVRY